MDYNKTDQTPDNNKAVEVLCYHMGQLKKVTCMFRNNRFVSGCNLNQLDGKLMGWRYL